MARTDISGLEKMQSVDAACAIFSNVYFAKKAVLNIITGRKEHTRVDYTRQRAKVSCNLPQLEGREGNQTSKGLCCNMPPTNDQPT
jgi:hypothetical protein